MGFQDPITIKLGTLKRGYGMSLQLPRLQDVGAPQQSASPLGRPRGSARAAWQAAVTASTKSTPALELQVWKSYVIRTWAYSLRI